MSAVNFSRSVMPVIRLSTPLLVLYFFSMFVFPWFGGDWEYVQSVWDRWQALNVGMLAFASTIIAFGIAQAESERQRHRQFIAARAFLPQALSDLTSYFRSSAGVFAAVLKKKDVAIATPSLPDDYKEIFSRCIQFAEPAVSEYLAGILSDLQVHQARLGGLTAPGMVNQRDALMSYIYSLVGLQARVNGIFDFARGEANIPERPPTWDEVKNAFLNLKLHVEGVDVEELKAFTNKKNAV